MNSLLKMRFLYILTIFFGAFLLFSVQPMIAKMILPELGGSPAVWQTVMVFFQILLLAGYGYVHFTSTRMTLKQQMITHFILLGFACLFLPFSLKIGHSFDRNLSPILWLFETLIFSISIPFFVLSTTAPILQKWFSLSNDADAKNPYFLYTSSNIGSLFALLSYPFIIEPVINLYNQKMAWSILFVIFSVLIMSIASQLNKNINVPTSDDNLSEKTEPPSRTQKFVWCFLSFIPSSLMLGVTSHVTTDIAAVPLLWIIPFALYLLSFVLVFSNKMIGYELSKKLLPFAILTLLGLGFYNNGIVWCAIIPIIGFFIIAVRYHGELVEQKPQAENLTYFYLCMSIGGASGGIFNAILAPVIFNSVFEYTIVLLISFVIIFNKKFKTPKEYILFFTPSVIAITVMYNFFFQTDVIFQERNFFGVSRVIYDDKLKANLYAHGRTNHGMQSRLEKYRLKPMTYYAAMQDFINLLPDDTKKLPLGITGLGIGTLTCYATDNQEVDVYEIDNIVIKIANDETLFTYMRDCKGNKNTILGDARINLQKASDKRYGFMIMDAYTSDALPIHLLTKEAFEIYLKKLDDNGIIALNISNRFIDLKPVLSAFAEHFNLRGYVILNNRLKDMTKEKLYTGSEWVILTKNHSLFDKITPDDKWKPLNESKKILWSDDYSSILPVLK